MVRAISASGHYATVRRDEFVRLFARAMPLQALENIEAAYAFSKGAHRNQMRDDGVTRYFEHCKSVAWIIGRELEISDDWRLIVIALLHDAKEDTFLLSDRRIEINFGPVVRQAIDDLSKRADETHAGYLLRLQEPAVDWRAMVVKLADRLQNLRTLGSCVPNKQDRKRAETEALYIPMMDRWIAGGGRDERWLRSLIWLRGEIVKVCVPAVGGYPPSESNDSR